MPKKRKKKDERNKRLENWKSHGKMEILKVSKNRKQNTKFSHPPKKQRTNNKAFDDFNFLIQPLFEVRAKNVQNFAGFLEDRRTWYFAFNIY